MNVERPMGDWIMDVKIEHGIFNKYQYYSLLTRDALMVLLE